MTVEQVAPAGTMLVVGDDTYMLSPDSAVVFDRDYEEVRSEGAVKPDLRWRFEHGDHEHQWVEDGKVAGRPKHVVSDAARDSRHVPCDGSCGGVCGGEGYTVFVWVCDATGDDLDPGYTPDPGPHLFLRGETLTVTLEGGDMPPLIEGDAKLVATVDGTRYETLLGRVSLHHGETTIQSGYPSQHAYSGSRSDARG